jgi:hypothetical protein
MLILTVAGGFLLGACHAFQFRRWMLLTILAAASVGALFFPLVVIASPGAFEDVRTDFGLLPYQVSGLMQLTSSSLLVFVFVFKEVVSLWRSPDHAPPGLRGVMKLEWVEPGSVQEVRMSGAENGSKPSPPLDGVASHARTVGLVSV